MPTKAEQTVDRFSAWNQAENGEPVFVLRAEHWRAVMALAITTGDKGGRMTPNALIAQALEMKAWHDDNDIPF